MITQDVEMQIPICESGKERIFKTSSVPVFYRVEVKCPDGTMRIFDRVRAYTKSLIIDEILGRIDIIIESEQPNVGTRRILYPYHYLHNGRVLCSLKTQSMRMLDDEDKRAFGMNYNLFDLNWTVCILLHRLESKLMAFVTSRAEWDRGNLNAENREVQMFLRVPEERHIPVSMMKIMVDPAIALWMNHCEAEMAKK